MLRGNSTLRGGMAHTRLTKDRLEEILRRRLRLRDVKFLLERAGDRFVGDIISPKFEGMRDHQRQSLIWDALEAELGADAPRLVGMILAYSPKEWNLGADEAPAAKKTKRAG